MLAPPAQAVAPVAPAWTEAWPIDEETDSVPWPLTGADEAPGSPGVDRHFPCCSVASDGSVAAGSVASDGSVAAGSVAAGSVAAGSVAAGSVADDDFTVTDPPPDALFPPAEPEPESEPPDGDADAFVDSVPLGGVAAGVSAFFALVSAP